MDKGLDHIINSSFSSQDSSGIPSWDNIASKLDEKHAMDSLVEKSFGSSKSAELPDAWDKIENQLIIDSTWSKIEASMNKKKRRRAGFFWASSVAMLVILSFFGYDLITQNIKNETIKFSSLSNISIQEKNTVNINEKNILKESGIKKPEKKSSIIDNSYSNDEEVNSNPKPFDNTVIKRSAQIAEVDKKVEDFSENDILIEDENSDLVLSRGNNEVKLSSVDLVKLNSIKPAPISTTSEMHSIEISKRPKKKSYRFSLGLLYEMNYNNIFDSKSRVAGESGSLYSQKFNVGHSAGIFLTSKLKRNVLLGMEFHFFNRIDRSIDEFRSGYLIHHDLKLDYLRTNLLAGYSFALRNPQHSIDILGGTYFSYLMKQKETISVHIGEGTFQESDYGKFNFGLSFKAGMNHSFKRFNLGYGISSNVGLINIYRNESELLQKLNSTNTFETGLYIKFGINL